MSTGWEILLRFVIPYIVIEVVVSVINKTPGWLVLGIFNVLISLWKETAFLQRIQKNATFSKWDINGKSTSDNFVELTLTDRFDNPINFTNIKQSITAKKPVLILGKPGSGKSTLLKTLYYNVSKETYKSNIFKWFALDLTAFLIFIYLGAPYALIWITIYAIC